MEGDHCNWDSQEDPVLNSGSSPAGHNPALGAWGPENLGLRDVFACYHGPSFRVMNKSYVLLLSFNLLSFNENDTGILHPKIHRLILDQ